MALGKRSHHPIQNLHLGVKKKNNKRKQEKKEQFTVKVIFKASPWKTALTQNKPTVTFQTRPSHKK